MIKKYRRKSGLRCNADKSNFIIALIYLNYSRVSSSSEEPELALTNKNMVALNSNNFLLNSEVKRIKEFDMSHPTGRKSATPALIRLSNFLKSF
jgi:hypothetical protein